MINELKDKYIRLVQKLSCGHIVNIPTYGTIRAYRNSKGSRVFSLSNSEKFIYPNGGNLSLKVVRSDIESL